MHVLMIRTYLLFLDEEAMSHKENMSPDHNADWLHRNDMYQRETICRSSEDQESNVDEGSMLHGPSVLSIREPSSPTIESSSEEDDEPRRLPSSFSFLA